MVSIICQFFFPTQKPRIARSLALLSIGTSPSVRDTMRYFSWFKAYVNASRSLPVDGTSASCSLRYNIWRLPSFREKTYLCHIEIVPGNFCIFVLSANWHPALYHDFRMVFFKGIFLVQGKASRSRRFIRNYQWTLSSNQLSLERTHLALTFKLQMSVLDYLSFRFFSNCFFNFKYWL